MRTHKVLVTGATVLTVGIVFLAVGRAADEKEPRDEVDRLAGMAAKDSPDLRKSAQAYAKDVEDLGDVMNLFKKREKGNKGGYGIGAKPAPGDQADGIEARIQNMAKKAPDKDTLKKEKDDLKQAMDRATAIGEIALAKPPEKAPGKDPKDWQKLAEDMVKEAKNTRKAIDSGDPKAVKEAAVKLNGTCTDCHGKFRD
jgi:hypothetical protein